VGPVTAGFHIVVVRTFISAPTAGLKACAAAISSQALKACTTFNQKTI